MFFQNCNLNLQINDLPEGGLSNLLLHLLFYSLFLQESKVLACCCYRDVSGLFRTVVDDVTTSQTAAPSSGGPMDSLFNVSSSNVDDEDDLLYGDSDITMETPTKSKH